MPWPLFDILYALPVFALVMFRISGLVMTAPVFGSSVIPMRIRAAMVMMTAAVVFPMVRGQVPADIGLGAALVGGVAEMMVGATIGLALSIFVMGAEVAGKTAGQQAGLAMSQVVDPTINEQVSTLGALYTVVVTVMFLMIGGHRATMAALLDTYEVVPILSFRFTDSVVLLLVEMLAAAFILGVRIGAPVIVAVFLSGIALGFLSRTMPQLNILTVGFTLRLLVALGVAGLALMASGDLIVDSIWDALAMVRASFGLDPSNIRLSS